MKKIKEMLKYFTHGLGISLLSVILQWSQLDMLLTTGIMILLGLLFWGFINGLLSKRLWGITVKSDYYSLIAQGFLFSLGLLTLFVVLIIIIAVTGTYSDPYTPIVVFLLESIPIGFFGKQIALHYEEDAEVSIDKLPVID